MTQSNIKWSPGYEVGIWTFIRSKSRKENKENILTRTWTASFSYRNRREKLGLNQNLISVSMSSCSCSELTIIKAVLMPCDQRSNINGRSWDGHNNRSCRSTSRGDSISTKKLDWSSFLPIVVLFSFLLSFFLMFSILSSLFFFYYFKVYFFSNRLSQELSKEIGWFWGEKSKATVRTIFEYFCPTKYFDNIYLQCLK